MLPAACSQRHAVRQFCNIWSSVCREVEDPQKDLVAHALLGTRNVLNAAVKSKATVKRVVLTSSFAGGARPQPLHPPDLVHSVCELFYCAWMQ